MHNNNTNKEGRRAPAGNMYVVSKLLNMTVRGRARAQPENTSARIVVIYLNQYFSPHHFVFKMNDLYERESAFLEIV
jgi:hypothetical protein